MKFGTLIAILLAALGLKQLHGAEGGSSILPLTLLSIDSIRLERTNVVVTAQVSAEFRRVTLESRPRLGSGNWEPIAVQHLGESSTQVRVLSFRIPRSGTMELLRLRGDSVQILPASFYQGTNSFGVPTSGTGSFRARGGGAFDMAPTAALEKGDTAAAPPATGEAREVVESDIWKIDGDTLYFFNQYRGLQVLDVKQPDAPVVRGTYSLPAAGEQMYLYDDNHVILLARDLCGGWSAGSQSQLILLRIEDGQPKLVAQLPVEGYIQESRLVGTALYVVAQQERQFRTTDAKGNVMVNTQWGSQVTSYDLSNFSEPKQKFKEWVPGYNNAIMATDRFLFVAVPQTDANRWWGNSDIRVFDISAPDGTTKSLSTIRAEGRVKDKFKMNVKGNVFTAVTEALGTTIKAQVETFSLADPANPKPLAKLHIIDREQVYATRYADNLLYVVTFLRIDPLWIIDLSDPTKPKKLAELEIPGWSTYIQPLGDRLVTVGIDNTEGWRTAVQLFDVQNPAKPSLLKKVVLGEQYSSSEANQDEKAFGVLPDEGLILVPYSSWSSTKGSFQGVHLIDLEKNTLRKRGSIDHKMQARRATVHRDRILSISGLELLTVDAIDRDNPKVVASTELSFSADRVFVQANHIIEISSIHGEEVSLRIAPAKDPSTMLKRTALSSLPLLGATLKDQRLYVVQGNSTEVIWPAIWNPTNYVPVKTNHANLTLSVYDVSNLPELKLLGQSQTAFESTHKYWNDLAPLWPKPGVLVWSGTQRGYWGWRGGPIAIDAALPPGGVGGVARLAPDSLWMPWWGGYGSSLLAFDVGDTSSPKFVSEVNLQGTNNWWNFSQAFAADGLVYLSHETSEFSGDVRPPPQTVYEPDGKQMVPVTKEMPPGAWVQRRYLNVINYSNPKDPSVRKPVNIPGTLIGIDRGGAVLFTQGYRYKDLTTWSDYSEWLDASAYDGVAAHLITSMAMPKNWPRAVLVHDSNLHLARTTDSNATSGTLEVWNLPDTGKFTQVGTTALKAPAQSLKPFGKLLAVQLPSEVHLYDTTNPSSPALRGVGAPGGCMGYNLEYADGGLDRGGLWVPLGRYGVTQISLKP